MKTNHFILLLFMLIMGGTIGTYFAASQGENWNDIFDRILRIVPAIIVFTILWTKRKNRISRN